MSCREIQTDLSALMDGELSAERAICVQGHCRQCAQCGEMLELLTASQEAFREVAPEPASGGLPVAVMAEIQPTQTRRNRYRWLGLIPAAAVAATLVWVILPGPAAIPTQTVIEGPGSGPEVYGFLLTEETGIPGLQERLESPALSPEAPGVDLGPGY